MRIQYKIYSNNHVEILETDAEESHVEVERDGDVITVTAEHTELDIYDNNEAINQVVKDYS